LTHAFLFVYFPPPFERKAKKKKGIKKPKQIKGLKKKV
jgi:hypothetical protein